MDSVKKLVNECRCENRTKMFKGSIAYFPNGISVNCILRNLSSKGAKLTFEDVFLIPDNLRFNIKNEKVYYFSKKIWHRAKDSGFWLIKIANTN